MRTGDKKVIGSMINIDQNIIKKNYTDDNIDEKLAEKFPFSYEIMNGK